MKPKKVLDVCCGSRMFYFKKENEDVAFMDIRTHYEELESGHVIDVRPDVVGDFRDIPFDNDSFHMVVFDPPHLINAGDNSWLAKKYGKLDKESWREDISSGFNECMRVLKPNGTLIFKWNEEQIALPEILKAIDYEPIFGQKRSKTQFLVFMKEDAQ